MLTHWGRDKMVDISQSTISNALSWKKIYQFWLIFKSPRVTGGLTVFGPFPLPPPPPPFCQHFSTFRKTLEANFYKPHMVDLWVWENFLAIITKPPKRDAIYFVPTIKWGLLIHSLQNLVGISPLSCFPFLAILVATKQP